ncbi:hypothetical protein V3C99_016602 [Haemonchus contortus]
MTSLQYNSIGPGRSADLADFRFDRRALKTKRCQTHVDSAGHKLLPTLAAQWKAVAKCALHLPAFALEHVVSRQ